MKLQEHAYKNCNDFVDIVPQLNDVIQHAVSFFSPINRRLIEFKYHSQLHNRLTDRQIDSQTDRRVIDY